MISSLKRFRLLCSRRELSLFWLLLVLGIIISVLQVASVASILPFLELATNPNALSDSPTLRKVYDSLGFNSEKAMIVAVAWMALLFQQKVAWTVSHNVSMRLVRTYGELPFQFFLSRDSSDLIRSTIEDINNLIDGVVLAGCNVISQLLIAALIFLMLFIVNPLIALSAVGVIGGIYLIIVFARRSYLTRLGGESLQATSDRYRTFVELISGTKAIRSNGAKAFFIDRFEKPSKQYSSIRPLIVTTYMVPRYLVESLAFGAVIFIILYLANSDAGFVGAVPTLTLFTLAGYRLIPAINGAYVSMAQMLNSYPAIDAIYNDIQAASDTRLIATESIRFKRSIKLSSVTFNYPEVEVPAVDGVTMEIIKGSKVAFVGPSGSGKTTIVDLILGLLDANVGSILVDDVALTRERYDSWRQLIGYVPQEVFLYNDTITNNIVFGAETIDEQQVKKAAEIAQISDFVETLPGRYVYRQPSVLVLDEATSALDNVTEGDVVKAIHEEIPDVTIIMIAHRMSTVVRCDKLYVVDRGKISAEGDYNKLLEESAQFRELAQYV